MIPAYWTDGKTAQRHNVKLSLLDDALVFYDTDNTELQRWPCAGLQLMEEVYRQGPARLKHKDHQTQVVTINDHAFLEILISKQPALRRRHLVKYSATQRLAIFGTTLASIVVAMFISIPYLASPIAASLPLSWEKSWGDGVASLMINETCTAPEGQLALNKLLQQITSVSRSRYTFKVNVTNDPLVNAFALPGGQIVIQKGLIDQADDGTEVAGVLAHEIAHIIERHPTEGVVRSIGTKVLIAGLIGDANTAASIIGEAGELLIDMAYSREDEAEADRLGISLLNKAGLRSDGLSVFFEKLQATNKELKLPDVLQYLSSHPSEQARIDNLNALMKPDAEPAMELKDWQALKNICDQVGPEPAPPAKVEVEA